LVLPFGLKTASQTFQRTIETILRPKCAGYARSYIDDTAIYSKSFNQHLEHLSEVLSAIEQAGLTLKLSKCSFAKSKVKFVGHLVGSGTREPLSDKVKALREIPEPTTKRALRSFLGAMNFLRAYIPKFSEVSVPLTDLTKAHVKHKICFNDVERAAFNRIKQKLGDAVALHAPDYSKKFYIHTDASDVAIGAMLSQENDDGLTLRPIAFASRKFTDCERRWCVLEREAYGVLFSLREWEHITWGYPIILLSDSNPLQWIARSATTSPKLTRWALALQKHYVTVQFIKGSANKFADLLSRHCL
jgi:hypothetical protein